MLHLGPLCDPSTLAPTTALATLNPDDLTKHAVCVGMTGSGKTGMCLQMLEEIARLGVPILAIDPKGDLGNLALQFGALSVALLAPWIEDPAGTADRWRQGLAEDGRTEADMKAWNDRTARRILTPGSEAGVPVDVLTALTQAPPHLIGDDEGMREYVHGAVSALLGLIGRDCDPVTDRPAILLAQLLGDAFAAGEAMPLDVLIPAVVDPPFEHLGVLTIETFLPRKERLELAKDLNAVIASPTFAVWRQGVPLDINAWMTPAAPGEKTPINIVYLAHLDDRQRMFVTTLLLHAVVAWSRRQPGTSHLRGLLYFDEVMGYLPPHPASPPSKAPILALMKQARAVGLGVVLSTQNPVDLDYKALSNAGTWLIGRLQTRQDRARVTDGLDADAHLGDLLARLPPRTFVLRNDRGVVVLRSRQTMSLLRGPLTRREVASLGQTWEGARPTASPWLRVAPPLPEGLTPRWLDVAGLAALGLAEPKGAPVYQPALYARFRVQFDDVGFTDERTVHRLLFPLTADGAFETFQPAATALEDAWLHKRPQVPGQYAPAPPSLATEGDVVGVRERWCDRICWDEEAANPDGDSVRPERSDVAVMGMVLVWVTTGG